MQIAFCGEGGEDIDGQCGCGDEEDGYEELTQAFADYAKRDRRFGGLSASDKK